MNDTFYMEKAIQLANKSAVQGSVPVGALIVKDDEIIAFANNNRANTKMVSGHSELIAIEKANQKLGAWNLSGCILYVTKEPCLMCAGAIMQSRIKKIVIGCLSKKDGCIVSKLNVNELDLNHKIKIVYGVKEKECSTILKEFFKNKR